MIHGICISSRTLKRVLSKNNMYRRKKYSAINRVVQYLQHNLNISGRMCGYRWMHLKCIQQGLVVTQEIVRDLLEILDPRGVELRKRKRLRRREYFGKGPNYLWHMDSYDKLKPYGICINGCIDGFSRHILWLRTGTTSNDPKVIAGYYIDTIKNLGGCPITIRSDMGTENVITENFQRLLRDFSNLNEYNRPSFMYGKSTGNQRIESWWSILRKNKAQYWMNLFEILRDDGLFSGTYLDKSLIQFCFMHIIQNELDEMVIEWNIHKIQKSRKGNYPVGRPIIMFEMPSLYNAENYLTEVSSVLLEFLEDECIIEKIPCDEDVYNLCNELILENRYLKSNDPYDAVQLYIKRRHINILLT